MKDNWKWTAAVLCAVGLFKEFVPSAPFLLEYAVEFRNFTSEEVTHEILPVTTYGYLASLLVLLFITDFLRYKPVILLGGVAAIATWGITIHLYNGIFYAMAIKRRLITQFKLLCKKAGAAMHTGKFLAGLCGQLLLSYHVMELDTINYLSLVGVIMFFITAWFLPNVKRSIYFHPRSSSTISRTMTNNDGLPMKKRSNSISQRVVNYPFRKRLNRALRAFWRDFKIAYFNRYVLRWSLWWSIAFAVYLQIGMYAESLWKEIEDETHEHNLNGAIDASHALLSAVFAIVLPYVKLPWERWGEIYLSFISLLQGAIILWMSQTHHLYVAYICYIIFQTMFHVVIIIASSEVAESVKEDSEAFIFGINTLIALVIQALLTVLITGEQGFELDIRDEFVVYGLYSSLLGVIFLLIAIQNRNKHWEVHSSPDGGVTEHEFSENVCSGTIVTMSTETKNSIYTINGGASIDVKRVEIGVTEGTQKY
ncbi:Thiamine transporter 1 [Orchesella cincta]|uniref:Thiamine transporter 1 n=1 Tax=Orchesella cincta TaxID=48709 RepID=A0A1D2MTH4_ORCCI|nr:Thiamine transporter 1 [Orchesella cincta]